MSTVNLSDYDKITVMWLLSAPWRFSFFKNKLITDILPTSIMYDKKTGKKFFPSTKEEYELGMKYVEFVPDDIDHILETSFYLRAVSSFCKAKNINFLYGSITDSGENYMPYFNEPEGNLNLRYNYRKIIDSDKSNLAFCGHPNDKGYNLLSSLLIENLQQNFSAYV